MVPKPHELTTQKQTTAFFAERRTTDDDDILEAQLENHSTT